MTNIKWNERYYIKGYIKDESYFLDWKGGKYNDFSESPNYHSFTEMSIYIGAMSKLAEQFDKLEFYSLDELSGAEELKNVYVINSIKSNLGIREFMRIE